MQLKYIIIALAIVVGILSQRSFAGEQARFERLVAVEAPNYLMNYKICFGSDCIVGEQKLVRDHFGTLKSQEKHEPVLDFIWNAIDDANPNHLKSAEEPMSAEQSWANNVMQRHAPDIARRQNGINGSTEQSDNNRITRDFNYKELSVSISIPYDEETLPQIMNAVECLKVQIADYNLTNSL